MNSLSTTCSDSDAASFSALSSPMREIGTGIPINASFTGSLAASLIAFTATGMSTLKSNPVEQNSRGSALGGCVSFGQTAPANQSGTLPRLVSAITGPYVEEKLELINRITFS